MGAISFLNWIGFGKSNKEEKKENTISEFKNEKFNELNISNPNIKEKEIREEKQNNKVKINEKEEKELINKKKFDINEEKNNKVKIDKNEVKEQINKQTISIDKIDNEHNNKFKIYDNEIKEKNNNLIKTKQKNKTLENDETKYKTQNKRIINIPNISDLDFFTSRDIQNKNKIITREIIKKAIKQIKDNDNVKNESIVKFLKNIAYISRKSFIKSKDILTLIINDYRNNLEKNFNINIEKDKKYLSSFVKKNIDNNYLYKQYLKKEDTDSSIEQKYLEKLFNELSIFYFYCKLAFPPIKINFTINEKEFNPETMIDFLNYGKGKVNFVFLPSLSSNQNFLQNAKLWVYTYNENEFFLDEESLNSLNEILK